MRDSVPCAFLRCTHHWGGSPQLATRHVREDVTDHFLGTAAARPGLLFRVLNVAPQDLTPQQQRQVLARFQMLGKDGGFGVRSLVEDGECGQLAMISEHLRGRVAGDKH